MAGASPQLTATTATQGSISAVPAEVLAEIDGYLAELWRGSTAPSALVGALREQVLHRGKRLRPALAMATAELLGHDRREVLPIAAAIELIHTYSLIHDDLPAMDDADSRRGEPTCHVRHGDGVAILIGDALFAEAFALIISKQTGPPARVLAAVSAVLRHTSITGIAAGQYLDLTGEARTADEVATMHALKTGGLFCAAMLAVAAWAGAPHETCTALERYATAIGGLFQLRDDDLDRHSTPAVLGKPTGSDERNGRRTFAATGGDPEERARALRREAAGALESFTPPPAALLALADFAGSRDR
jgi:geranylgeranyl diphosphate synthase type II